MMRKALIVTCLVLGLAAQSLAETADYHLKRLEIQTRAVLAIMGEDPSTTPLETQTGQQENAEVEPTLQMQLDQAVEAPTWAENMAKEDLHSVLSTSQTLQNKLRNADTDEYLKAKVELESLARRLRISTAPLELAPQNKASLELLMLELNEAANAISQERDSRIAQKDSRRRRSQVNIGIGYGYGYGYGPWGPGAWGPWGYSRYGWNTWYRPYRRIYRRPYRICR